MSFHDIVPVWNLAARLPDWKQRLLLAATEQGHPELPVSMGGMGLRRICDNPAIAYSASVVTSAGLIEQLTDPRAEHGDSKVADIGNGAAGKVEAGA